MENGARDIAHLRDAVVGALREKIPGVESIEPHVGAFTDRDVTIFLTKTPAIRVAIVGAGQARRHNLGVLLPVNCAAAIVTRDAVDGAGAKLGRDLSAMLIANAVLLGVMSNRFGLAAVFQPEDVRASNEYAPGFYEKGLALWQVSWTSPVVIGVTLDEAVANISRVLVNGVELWPGEAP